MNVPAKLILSVSFLGLTSCPFSTMHYKKLFVRPDWPMTLPAPEFKKIGIALTGNSQYHLIPDQEPIGSLYSTVGGMSALKSYMDIFKKRYGKTQLIVNTGSLFPDNVAPPTKQQILEFYDQVGYDAIGLTAHNLMDFLQQEGDYQKNRTPILAGNIIDLATGKPLKKTPVMPYKIVKKNGIKMGIIALASLKTVSKEDKKKLKGVYFEDPIASFLRIRQIFRRKKIKVTLLLTQLQGECSSPTPYAPFDGSTESRHPIQCGQEHPGLSEFVKRLPPRSVDLILSSGNNFAMGYLNGIPLAQLAKDGKSLGTIELYYDTKKGALSPEKTTFYPPVKLCHKFFSSTHDCHIDERAPSAVEKLTTLIRGKREYSFIPAKFLGYEVMLEQTEPN